MGAVPTSLYASADGTSRGLSTSLDLGCRAPEGVRPCRPKRARFLIDSVRRLSTAAKVNAAGLVLTAAGMLVQIAAGSTLYPSVTGPIVLLAAAVFVAFGPGRWTPYVGLVVPLVLGRRGDRRRRHDRRVHRPADRYRQAGHRSREPHARGRADRGRGRRCRDGCWAGGGRRRVSAEVAAAILLIAVPIAFNLAFFELGRAFDYPNILRKEPDEILRRFAAGGSGLVLRWQALLVSALAMLPLVALAGRRPRARRRRSRRVDRRSARPRRSSRRSASCAGRSPSRSSPVATSRPRAPTRRPPRRTIEVVFATLHRLLGVGIGEHLGYLLTGLWTLLVAASILSTAVLPGWLGVVGLPIGVALLVGTLEFVGPNEKDGWPLAGTIVPIAYIAWSLWLVALGIALLVT